MKQITLILVALVVLIAISLVLLVPDGGAVPSYFRRYGIDCSTCHIMWGALNGAGVTFRLSGYRAINGRDLKPVEKDIELANGLLAMPMTIPASIITGVGVEYRNERRQASDGTSTNRTGFSFALEDASIFISSPLGKHLSTFMEFPMYETRAWEFTPTGPATGGRGANDKTTGPIKFQTESPVFEVAKFWCTASSRKALPRVIASTY